ncbi:hypothetical protein CWB96_10935 [Pseudoalteromonas citrea]|uniref:Sulfotransferase n=1 Tax=Pseudoalteromonas citrea TaxID=43655 RepID=A0A5S3XQ98_9GAMM|nr:sulfotransferase family 2 domain-containing protein [Pseudoalteromonas citrea]TMP45691.1 hypothetical protein CWB97_03580 [Pseudoalteromonas citrea]TMP59070.1 hypothetical protein CWB96_10935 [Pseudoalteromonas citrea]
MISTKDNCVFVHVPKVAGQSIELFFVERMGLTWQQRSQLLLKPNSNPQFGPPRLAHLYADEYVKYNYVTTEQFSDYFKFSFVRNPWERLVSEFTYRKALGHKQYQGTFKSFVLTQFPTPERDDYENGIDHYRHIVPQSRFIYDSDGKCLVDFIGRFESLQQDFTHVCQQLRVADTRLPHKNSTANLSRSGKWLNIVRSLCKPKQNKRHYSEYYCTDTKDFVTRYYQEDIDRFGYIFEEKV